MNIVYKKPYKSRYQKIVDKLSRIYPSRQFRVKISHGEHYDHEIGVEELTGTQIGAVLWGGTWQELDLEAMGCG
jgi:hypothetical protein